MTKLDDGQDAAAEFPNPYRLLEAVRDGWDYVARTES